MYRDTHTHTQINPTSLISIQRKKLKVIIVGFIFRHLHWVRDYSFNCHITSKREYYNSFASCNCNVSSKTNSKILLLIHLNTQCNFGLWVEMLRNVTTFWAINNQSIKWKYEWNLRETGISNLHISSCFLFSIVAHLHKHNNNNAIACFFWLIGWLVGWVVSQLNASKHCDANATF